MLAFTRKPANDESTANTELLLDDADDDLAPLTTNTPAPGAADDSVAPRTDGSTRLIVAPRWTSNERAAYASLLDLVAAHEPRLGWRGLLFIVSGIRLAPSRSERVLREHIATLARSVDPAILDDEKEAAS